ncbi:MAG: mechanosensitive ion channel family protein, partial [Gammaproteobacteria bacterium]
MNSKLPLIFLTFLFLIFLPVLGETTTEQNPAKAEQPKLSIEDAEEAKQLAKEAEAIRLKELERYSKLYRLEQRISKNIDELRNAKGVIAKFTKYRIKENINKLHHNIQTILSEEEQNIELLIPLAKNHLQNIYLLDKYSQLANAKLIAQLGSGDENVLMVEFSANERQRDALYQSKIDLIGWLEQLDVNVASERTTTTDELIDRADKFNSLILFTQSLVNSAVADAETAGVDVTSEQTTAIIMLNKRLFDSSASLNSTVQLLDLLEKDTVEYKETLLTTSGAITQDVLDVDVATNLAISWYKNLKGMITENGPDILFKLIMFIAIVFIAKILANGAQELTKKAVTRSELNFSVLLQEFFTTLVGKLIFILGLLVALSQLGINLTPLLTGFGVAGLIIGFALQDTLSNFASGMMILVYRPFDVGDLINAASVTGKVSHMSLVSTTIKTLDNQRLIIPNNKIWGDTINNITVENNRRVDMTFGIGYSDDIEKAEKV